MRLMGSLWLAIGVMAACSSGDAGDGPPAADGGAAAVPNPADTSVAGTPAAAGWDVTPKRIGAVAFGMSIDDFQRAGGEATVPAEKEYCTYGKVAAAPAGVSFMIENGRVVRVDVDSASVRTPEGAQVGDTEETIKRLYPAVSVMPHKYTNGHYLTVKEPADSTYRIIFETDGQKVTQYRAGVWPQVGYVERCS